ncbi:MULTISPECIES: amino acid aminotransferase [unclassified Rhizobium]|uniref:amino acid aminotransferase n=1 Tax=unclassified Rhizobium TaxID=2613769 RepID=UPI001A984997|nr:MULTISPECIES: amino acid aminotransferase [unclassified Rhizobium]MBX5168584.1 aspartate/tyrosine/aromatic aminotransferase [Rhizobium sp. NZLR1b]MBX5181808.1 aspartate/tyrosine/aromatic aminotransferase [Rhizobium sp. NZLR5]MBX5187850.1 aspartate/tyrosine/aromatic aminotransferase [Rhizobium sp. NZLR3b]MBX5194231.1 aspartate/tyrosine/aromatic aminotransferase [Rhizobium sp. NZLR10]MBX5199888.1 aspartate/tyrosine/aromatic aminotransferase [Rhizobium sp. NZLR1]
MFDQLNSRPADSLLALIKAFHADDRSGKVDLGVGVYRDIMGRTPVMRAVKAAEQFLLETQDSKKYLGPEGDLQFVRLLQPIIFGKSPTFGHRLVGIQTPGGSGALRLGAELIQTANPSAKVLLGTPSWPNHAPIFGAARLPVKAYAFVDLTLQQVKFESVIEALSSAGEGDVVLLHGCCHNPTGIDFTMEQWRQITALLVAQKLVPFIDLAYQGLGDGLEHDAAPTRMILDAVDEALIAYSCDKNFGLYRERVGALYVMARNVDDTGKAESNMAALARVNWSMPPDHGAAIVRTILESDEMSAMWRAELEEMCQRVNGNRAALAAAAPDLAFISQQRGLFSNLSMSKETAVALRAKHGIYMADSGRMNLAGMQPDDACAIVAALRAEGCLKSSMSA